MNPEEFYTHALRAADAEGRLPLSRITAWDVFPFEQTGLRVVPLNPPVLPEPPGRRDRRRLSGLHGRPDAGLVGRALAAVGTRAVRRPADSHARAGRPLRPA